MSSPEPQSSLPVPTPAPAASAAPTVPGQPPLVTVICPTGFTKSSMEGVDPKKPLYARVTYRPV